MWLESFLQKAVGFLWGTPLIVLVIGSGIYFTLGTGFFQFKNFGHFWKRTFSTLFDKEDISTEEQRIKPLDAVATAVGGAVGVGNIGGVATAIAMGGPGALFWLWIAALFGMALKSAEVSLAVYYRNIDENGDPYGGPTYYIQKGLGELFKGKANKVATFLALVFGVGFATNFFTGIQAYTITEGVTSVFNIDMITFGVIYSIVVLIIVLGGGESVTKFAGKIVPIMIILFCLGALGIVLINIKSIPSALGLVFSSAFTGQAAIGGFTGATFAKAIQFGVSRAVFSNEAGQGSSTMIHSQTNVEHPIRQGIWGMFEVFVDTIIVCTMIALAIIVSGQWSSGLEGAALSISAFSVTYGKLGGYLVAISVLLFGLTTQTGWFTYYDVLLRHALKNNIKLKNKILKFFRWIYPLPGLITIAYATYYGMPTGTVWLIADFFMAVPTTLNIICVVALSGIYFKLMKDYKARYLGIGEIDPDFKVFYEDKVGSISK